MIDHYAVIGNPIAHSKSPLIHAAFARQTGEALVYTAIEAPSAEFVAAVDQFRARGGRGLNVTMPFKGDAFAYADEVSDRARLTQSVNTLIFVGERAKADTTDGVGLVRDIVANLGVAIGGRRVLLLGAGGAVRSVVPTILEQQPQQLVIANRTLEKAIALGEQFAAYDALCTSDYAALAGAAFDLVINGTAASMADALPPLPSGCFAANSLAYDMVYGKRAARFLAYAAAQGAARCADGIGMLVEGAAEAFYLWRGIRPATRAILAQLQQEEAR